MAEILGKLIELLKTSFSLVIGLFLASLLLILFPQETIDNLGLTQFMVENKQWVSIVLLVSGSVAVVEFVVFIYKEVKARRDVKKEANEKNKRLRNLTEAEKNTLAPYILYNERERLFMKDAIVKGLEKEEILIDLNHQKLIYTEDGKNCYTHFTYFIPDWIWYYLKEHPEYVLNEEQLADYRKRQKENPDYSIRK